MMTENFYEYHTRQSWEESFGLRIGASEIAIICGFSHFKSTTDLWREKTGRKKPDDISDNELVSYGKEAEKHLRALFGLKHKNQYDIDYHELRVYFAKDAPFLSATLDGELIEKDTGRRGIYECKTCYIQSKHALEEWERGHIPDKYYCQLCQQFYVTGFDFAVLNAELRFPGGKAEIREYYVERSEIEDDIAWVADKGKDFWEKYVFGDKEPPVTINL